MAGARRSHVILPNAPSVVLSEAKDLIAGSNSVSRAIAMRSFAALRMTGLLGVTALLGTRP